jgi:F420-dependent oxidoreductase-like protein
MKVGINTNPLARGGRPASIDEITEQVAGIARQGFASAAFSHLLGMDALTVVALVGRVVPQIELATAVVPIYIHHPFALAQQALTTNAAIGGRLTLGIGLSHKPVVEQVLGMSFERPVEYMREYLAILLPLLRGEPVDYQGKRLRTSTRLSIVDATAPSVLLAALGERMLRLAGEQTNGTALWMVGARTVASHVTPTITAAAEQAGRAAPRIVVGLPICVTHDVTAARERAARSLGFYGQLPSYRAMLDREGVAGPADVMLAGSEEAVERQLNELEQAGATEFNAVPIGSSDERSRTFEFLQSWVAHARGTAV